MKKFKSFKKKVALGLLSIVTVSNMASGTGFAKAESSATDPLVKLNQLGQFDKLRVEPSEQFKDTDKVRVIVELEGDPAITFPTEKGIRYKDLPERTKASLQAEVKGEQSDFLSDVESDKIDFNVENSFTTVVNGVSGEVEYGKIDELENLPNVESVSLVNEYERPQEQPQMISSKNLVEAIQTWNAGYNGKGMVVGIIDTGIDFNHPDMKLSADTQPKLTSAKVDSLIKSGNLPGKYYTAKVPYGYNYMDNNQEIRDLGPNASMHGMHVAGTVGANGDESKNGIKGVAPEAQLLALKVFGNDPGMKTTFSDIYIKAIDDGITLGADVLNMSLGSIAGFVESTNLEQQAIDRAVNNGVLMSISAGNSAHVGNGSPNPSLSHPFASNPDIGLVGDPGVATNSISVASIENDKIILDQMAIKVGSETLPIAYKTQESPKPKDVFGTTKEMDVVYVGDGNPGQYTGKDVNGKVVFVVRTAANPNYVEIKLAAEMKGAAGVIVRGLPSHGDYVGMALDAYGSPKIPFVSLSQSDGNTLEAKIKAAGGTAKVTFGADKVTVVNSAAGKMSTFSSWGVTPELNLKPEITAPGGQIYSTLNDGQYGVMSGTSMAAPHVSGGSALVLQRVHELFPDLKGMDMVKRAKTMLMNTAKIIPNASNGNIPYSPRQQGSGLMQLHSAVTTPVYVVNKGTNEGKVELKEISQDKFTMTVTATNFSDKDVNYKVNASVLTDAVSGSQLTLNDQEISKAKVEVDAPDGVTISAGGSKDITFQVDLSDAKADLESLMPNGYFVEGFITLTSDDQNNPAPNISVPYVGFKGDWNKPPILDNMLYDAGSYFADSYMVNENGYALGQNPWTFGWEKRLIAINPNGNEMSLGRKAIAPVLSFLRNSKTVEYSITDANGKTIRKLNKDKNQRKNYYAQKDPHTVNPYYTLWDGKVNNEVVADGLYYYQIKTQVDLPGKDQQVVNVPFQVDTVAPTVTSASYDKKTGIATYDVQDKETGSGLLAVEFTVRNGDSYRTYARINLIGKKSASGEVNIGTLPDGSTIDVTAYDAAWNTSGIKLSSDNTIPSIIVASPRALGVYDTREIPLTGYVTDNNKNVDYLKVTGDKITGSPIDVNLKYNSTTKRWEFATQLQFTEDGVHDIYIEGADEVGNKIQFRRQVMIDTTAPTLDVKGLPDNNYVAEDGKAPELTVSLGDNFDEIDLKVNGSLEYNQKFEEPYAMRNFTYDYKFTPELSKGKNDLVFEVVDLVGHTTEKTITIYKGEKPDAPTPDPVKPEVTPVTSESTVITGKSEKGTEVIFTDKKDLTLTAKAETGTFSIPLKNKIAAGTILYAKAKDANGKESPELRIIVIDKTPPNAPTVKEVGDNDKKITGKAEADSKVIVKAGKTTLGSGTADKNGNFSIPIKAQKAGTILTVTATDKAGNASKAVNVTVKDKTPPTVLTVNVVGDNDKKITGKAEAGSKVIVKAGKTILGSGTADKNGNFSIPIKAQKAGTILAVTATDKAGNASKAVNVTVKDKTPPTVPTVNNVKSSSTKITGKTEAGAKVYVKDGKKVIGSTTANNKGEYSITIKKQKRGTTLYVYAKDKPGNTSKSRKVIVN
ncbi:S8 family serine peptidase [Bacillus sp. sid0103]|uniref:Ig-like domain-containing protein n=1 Tax=Bacillus sp. sid0103 TaxID=2856337 RepID=UPI001C48D3EF|nr:Ig-like domain-containing protein [Bacillus sp. sid0103]MBV7508767.1 S8 family serine peptidase [Bacillus sp. sid0103]